MNMNRMAVNPIDVPRTNRVHTARSLTSLPAGKMVPIFAAGLLREDAARGRMRFSFEMMETAEALMNSVRVDVKAYVVPMLALDRFQGSMDVLNRSYEGVAPLEGEAVIPYIETENFGSYATNDIYVYLGLHGRPTQKVNTSIVEAYNQIWNFRATNRSKSLTPRTRLQKNLAPAFWNHEMFRHVVPDYDQAKVDGEVALNVTNARMPIKGIGHVAGGVGTVGSHAIYETGSTTTRTITGRDFETSAIKMAVTGTGNAMRPEIFAELEDNGITVSLANIELAKKTQAFARLREQYAGHSDEWLINLLMDGISIPDQAYKQPILVGQASTIFGMSKRYATDSGNLTESVVNGATFCDLAINLPRLTTGGVLMVVAEITPEQLFERQRDAWLHAENVDELPHFLRDYLDPEKVSIVPNEYVDIDHDTPAGTFGYAPLNYEWNVTAPRIGGRFYRPQVDAGFDEDRQRLWAVETQNPTLGPDFYLCTNIHTKPFVVTNQDPFEVVTQGDLIINGNTQFGAALIEASNDYQKVLDQVDLTRIEKE